MGGHLTDLKILPDCHEKSRNDWSNLKFALTTMIDDSKITNTLGKNYLHFAILQNILSHNSLVKLKKKIMEPSEKQQEKAKKARKSC